MEGSVLKADAWKRQGAHQVEPRQKTAKNSRQNAFLPASRRNAPSENTTRYFAQLFLARE
jgi:hypothetical protein